MDHCDSCAFRYDDLAQRDITSAVEALAATYVRRLAPDPAAGPDVEHDLRWRAHPVSGVWSALEYACHVRDVLLVQRERVHQVLTEDLPAFVPMGREERVERDRYNERPIDAVAMEIAAAARSFAAELDALDDAGWARTGIYNWPTHEERTVTWIARHTVHEMEHHLRDIDAVLAAAS
jgi:hypothetical protein